MVDQTTLLSLLGLMMEDARLSSFLSQFGTGRRRDAEDADKEEGTGEMWVEFPKSGMSAMFASLKNENEGARHSIGSGHRLIAFHLHSNGHEGFDEFKGLLGGGVNFGDTQMQVEGKLGLPSERGGGGTSKVLRGQTIPIWYIYRHGATFSHYQFDRSGLLELVTLMHGASTGT